MIEKIQGKSSLKFDNLADPDQAIHENTAFLQTMTIDVEMSHEMLKLIQLCFKNINKHFQRNFENLAKDFSKIKKSEEYKKLFTDLVLTYKEFNFIQNTICT